MKNLEELVDVVEDNNNLVILKVKEESNLDLIKIGCFTGEETMFRLTKGRDRICTVWYSNRQPFTWQWPGATAKNGIVLPGSYTLVDDQTEKMGRLIQKMIEQKFNIPMWKTS